MRVRAEGEEAVRGRLRSSTSVKLSRLGCLSSLTWFACSPSELPLLYPSVCLAVQCTSCYMDVATAFPFVSILNFTAWVIAHIDHGSRKCLCFQGSAIVYQRSSDNEDPIRVGKLGPSDYFGENFLRIRF